MARKHFLVIGIGRFGSGVATTLFQDGHEVVVIDIDESRVEAIMEHVTDGLIGDATDPSVLEQAGVADFDTVIVAIGNDFEANILATLAAKAAGAKRVLCKAVSEPGSRVLSKIGADVVVRPEHDMGVRVAEQLTSPKLVDAFSLGENHTVIEIEAHDQLFGRLDELRLPNRFGVQVIAVHHSGELIASPGASYEVVDGDKLVLIGSKESISEFRSELGG